MRRASFADQYQSFLNLTGPAEILRAVRLVWASLWHPAPRAYRRAHGVADDDLAMAVVLMRMVPAVRGGVAFTADPGDPAAGRIEAVEGLAEALVAGAITPDAWTAPRVDIRSALDGAPPPIADVAELALKIEHAFGLPLDVEWAWDGADLWIVQARPITSGAAQGDGFDSPTDRDALTTAGIAETLPGVLPPLIWQVAAFCVEEALRRVLDDVGTVLDARVDHPGLVRRARDLDMLKRAARSLPLESETELERQYFGEVAPASDADRGSGRGWGRGRSLFHDLRVMSTRRRAIHEAETVIVAAAEVAAGRPTLTEMGVEEVLAYRSRLIDLGARAMAAELGVAAGAAASYARLDGMLRRHLGDAGQRWAQYITTGRWRDAGGCAGIDGGLRRTDMGGGRRRRARSGACTERGHRCRALHRQS